MIDSTLRDQIFEAVVDGDTTATAEATNQAVAQGAPPLFLIEEVLNPALKEVGDRFDAGDMFLPQLIMSAEAMEAAMETLQPLLESSSQSLDIPARVVMATVKGDVHDIGKNIVCSMLKANGFKVFDLGRDVAAPEIIAKADEVQADIIGLSALLSTTLPYCRDTIELLSEKGIRDKYHVFIGGGAATPEYAEKIGAKYGGAHAEAAVRNMLEIMGRA